jgi:hypothetical protein
MVNLFDSSELKSRVFDLIDVIQLHEMTRSREFDFSQLLLRQAILQSIGLNQQLFLFGSEFATLVDKKTKLSDALHTIL